MRCPGECALSRRQLRRYDLKYVVYVRMLGSVTCVGYMCELKGTELCSALLPALDNLLKRSFLTNPASGSGWRDYNDSINASYLIIEDKRALRSNKLQMYALNFLGPFLRLLSGCNRFVNFNVVESTQAIAVAAVAMVQHVQLPAAILQSNLLLDARNNSSRSSSDNTAESTSSTCMCMVKQRLLHS
eukprot:3019-Heterococcus_DN1.PRE.1